MVRHYYMLLASLPALGWPPQPRQTPLSRLRLEQRLDWLAAEDAQRLALLEGLLRWERLPLERSDGQLLDQARQVLARLDDPGLEGIVIDRLEIRTAVAALRRRHQGQPPPSQRDWGFGRWRDMIRRRWSEPHFGLSGVYPWLPEAYRLLEAGDTRALERLLLEVVWKALGRAGEGHDFDRVAVAVYLLRWDIWERWLRYDGQLALERFDELVAAGLKEYGPLSS
ncbi:MAG: hypothetical protein R3310_06815 [Candidatus Competibacteraceae bacterium]|nr:hypothetical protein [Candidatus Competibacteraceae bacterium]